jgi:superfamily I DNA/RNA helicase
LELPRQGADKSTSPATRRASVEQAPVERCKGLGASVVVLAEIDGRLKPELRGAVMYVGATRAKTDLFVIADEARAAWMREIP